MIKYGTVPPSGVIDGYTWYIDLTTDTMYQYIADSWWAISEHGKRLMFPRKA